MKVPTRRLALFSGAIAVAVALGLAVPQPVAADCDGPVPSFRQYAPTAAQIVIGDVIAVDPSAPWTAEGRSSRFTLDVRYVLRGRMQEEAAFRDLAYLDCADHIIMVGKGDRVALALHLADFPVLDGFKGSISTIAWITGKPADQTGVERISVREAFELAGLRAPATDAVEDDADARTRQRSVDLLMAAGIVIAFLTAVAASRRVVAAGRGPRS